MQYVITGSLGHISQPLTQLLLQAGHQVSVISSDPHKATAIEQLGAVALIGSLADKGFVTQAFRGANAVYTMIPPNLQTSDWAAYIQAISEAYQAAIQASGVPKVVHLSAMGAHLAQGAGLASLYHQVEQQFNALAAAEIVHLRPATFYTNFLGNMGLIKQQGIMGSNYGDVSLPMTHPNDIAQAAFAALTRRESGGKAVQYVVSDERWTDQIAGVLGASIGKPALGWVRFSDEDAWGGMVQAGLSEDVATQLVAMGQAVARGESMADYRQHPSSLYPTKLEEFAVEFAKQYAVA